MDKKSGTTWINRQRRRDHVYRESGGEITFTGKVEAKSLLPEQRRRDHIHREVDMAMVLWRCMYVFWLFYIIGSTNHLCVTIIQIEQQLSTLNLLKKNTWYTVIKYDQRNWFGKVVFIESGFPYCQSARKIFTRDEYKLPEPLSMEIIILIYTLWNKKYTIHYIKSVRNKWRTIFWWRKK